MSKSRTMTAKPVSTKQETAALVLDPDPLSPATASAKTGSQTANTPSRPFMVRLSAEVIAEVRAAVYHEDAQAGTQKGLFTRKSYLNDLQTSKPSIASYQSKTSSRQ